jgi:hypothetical protein
MKNNEHTFPYNSDVNVYVQILGSISGPYKANDLRCWRNTNSFKLRKSPQADQPLAEVIKYFTKSAVASGRNKAFRSLYNCSLQQLYSSVCITTEPRTRESVNWVSIPCKAKRVCSSTQRRDRLWIPPSNLVDGYRESTFRESLPLAERHGAGHLRPPKPEVLNAWKCTSASPFVFRAW